MPLYKIIGYILWLIQLEYTVLGSKTSKENRICFSKYSDFFHGALQGDWSEIDESEWEHKDIRKKVLHVHFLLYFFVFLFRFDSSTTFFVYISYLYCKVWKYDMPL